MKKLNNFSALCCIIALVIFSIFISARAAQAQPIFMDNSATAMWSDGFKVPPASATTVTLQHYSVWEFGDVFGFWDLAWTNPDGPAGTDFSWYGEISPRFSVGKIFETDASFGPVKDVLLAFNLEHGQAGKAVQSINVGAGFDLNIPGFQFFELDVYGRMPRLKEKFDDIQITIAWARPFKLGEQSMLFSGFCDFMLGVGDVQHQTLCQPRLQWQVGEYLGLVAGKVAVGFELGYWDDKYRLDSGTGIDSDELALNAIIQFHF